MRTGRRLKAWEKAGLIRRNAEAIIATTSVTSTVTDVTPTVAEAGSVTLVPEASVTRRYMMPVKLAAFIVALALACVRRPFLLMASPQSLPARSGPARRSHERRAAAPRGKRGAARRQRDQTSA